MSDTDDEIERMMHQIADLFKLVDDGKMKPIEDIVTPEIKAQLDKAKELVDKFAELNNQVFLSGGIKPEELNQVIQNSSPKLSAKQKKILEFSKKLKNDIEIAKEQLTSGRVESKNVFNQDKQTAKERAKRKKKFKNLGGDNWLPL